MRILFTNLAATATLSAGGTVSVNYPLANLSHVFLVKRFQQIISALSDAQALTLTWATDQTIDTVLLGYTNGTAFTLKLYDSAGTLLSTQSFTSAQMGKVFAAVSGVRSAKLIIDDGSGIFAMTVYLGGLGIGLSYAMPDPLADWEPGFEDNSFGATTIDGQVLGQYVEPLRTYTYNFFVETLADYDEIVALIKAAGKYTPLFIAPTEGDMAQVLPIYATIQFSAPKKDGRLFTFSLTFKEAR